MSSFLSCYPSTFLVCEYRLSYYNLVSIFVGPYATIAIIIYPGVFGQAMSGWIGRIHLGGHHSNFFHTMCHTHWICWKNR